MPPIMLNVGWILEAIRKGLYIYTSQTHFPLKDPYKKIYISADLRRNEIKQVSLLQGI